MEVFVTKSPVVKEVDAIVAGVAKRPLIVPTNNQYDSLMRACLYCGFETTAVIERSLTVNQDKVYNISKQFKRQEGLQAIRGISVLYLCHYIMGTTNSVDEVENYLGAYGFVSSEQRTNYAQEIVNAASGMKQDDGEARE